jgi:hypothetical protein
VRGSKLQKSRVFPALASSVQKNIGVGAPMAAGDKTAEVVEPRVHWWRTEKIQGTVKSNRRKIILKLELSSLHCLPLFRTLELELLWPLATKRSKI